MALFNLNEISNIISDMIRSVIEIGYHIDPAECKSDVNGNDEFKAVLVKDTSKFTVKAIDTSCQYLIEYLIHFNDTIVKDEVIKFYKIKENIYSNNKDEAASMLSKPKPKTTVPDEVPSIKDMIAAAVEANKRKADSATNSKSVITKSTATDNHKPDVKKSREPRYKRLDDYITLKDFCDYFFG